MMKRIYSLVALMSLMGVCGAVAQEVQRFNVKVGDFTHLLVKDHINVVYRCNADSAGYACFVTETAKANKMIFSNNQKGKLTISVSNDSIYAQGVPTVTVYSAYLQNAENQGDSLLKVESVKQAPFVKFKLVKDGLVQVDHVEATTVEVEILTGKGKVTVNGECTDFNVKNTGKAEVRAEGLKAKNVSCRIIGSGNVYCTIDGGKMSLKGSGTGKLYYHGRVKEMKSMQLGSLKAICLDNTEENATDDEK